MRIIIGDHSKKAMEVLGIPNYPFTPEELSKKFKVLLFKWHPDKNNNSQEANEMTKELISSYKHLKNLAISINASEEDRKKAKKIFKEDEDMFSLWETCIRCNGTGQIPNPYTEMEKACPDCNPIKYSSWSFTWKSSGIKTLKCKYCKGTGLFIKRNGEKVTCTRCNGSGIWKKVKCRTCKGKGFIMINTEPYITCGKCNGVGKIKLNPFNPVIRKGAIL